MIDPDLETTLRTVRPLKVVALLDDDREVPIAIPRGPRRWERLAITLNSQPWVEVRMLDKANALLAPPVTRGERAAPPPPAGELEDVSGGRGDRMVDATIVERLLRAQMDITVRGFTEVAKVMRSAGSTEVTAALGVHRETIAASHALVQEYRAQLDEAHERVRELEAELAVRLADDDAKPKEEAPKSATERLIESFAGGFVSGTDDAKPKNGHHKEGGA